MGPAAETLDVWACGPVEIQGLIQAFHTERQVNRERGGWVAAEWQEDKLDRTAHVWNHSEDLKEETLCCFLTFSIFP